MSRILTVTSGKGGVGKTNISVNLALYLASQDYKVCLFDADMGLANIDILLGLYPEHTLEDVISKEKRLRDIIIRDYSGIDIIPGSSGVKKMADPEPGEIDFLIDELSELEDYDFFFFDASAGISKNVVSFCMASPEIILVVTPEPTSLTDAYALLKILHLNGYNDSVLLAINQCSNVEVASNLFTKFKMAVQKYLTIDISPLGTIPLDPHVAEAVKEQRPFISLFPNTDASKGVKNIARHLISRDTEIIDDYDLNKFWPRCFEFFESPLQLSNKKTGGKTLVEKKDATAGQEKKEQLDKDTIPILADTANEKIPEERTDISQERIQQSVSQDIRFILEDIAKGISSISSELGAIRRVIELNMKS